MYVKTEFYFKAHKVGFVFHIIIYVAHVLHLNAINSNTIDVSFILKDII
jgi:hypothetical protein